ncbi:MAG: L-2-amino-thiazoline-4-carboxylic acid hydrolase [Chloroflexi bacterium]|nr:L-2-amino-thiazoline-4-carboxylic acid hydrolase [Chloroflexota bacterium]
MRTSQSLTRRDFLKLSAAGFCGLCLASCVRQTESASDTSYWQENYTQLMDDFNAILNPVCDEIVALCGEQEASAIMDESRKAYEVLLPQVPFIGGDDNSLTETLYMSATALASYQVMLSHGQPLEEVGRILYRATESLFNFNDPLASAQSRNPTGKAAQDEFRRMAKWSEQSPYPDDWKLTFVEGDGENFDFGVDYTECGIVKFYQSQQADKLAPYLCLGDFPLSQALDTGLVRTTTLARGGPCCDFRFKAGRPIQREWTPNFLEE